MRDADFQASRRRFLQNMGLLTVGAVVAPGLLEAAERVAPRRLMVPGVRMGFLMDNWKEVFVHVPLQRVLLPPEGYVSGVNGTLHGPGSLTPGVLPLRTELARLVTVMPEEADTLRAMAIGLEDSVLPGTLLFQGIDMSYAQHGMIRISAHIFGADQRDPKKVLLPDTAVLPYKLVRRPRCMPQAFDPFDPNAVESEQDSFRMFRPPPPSTPR